MAEKTADDKSDGSNGADEADGTGENGEGSEVEEDWDNGEDSEGGDNEEDGEAVATTPAVATTLVAANGTSAVQGYHGASENGAITHQSWQSMPPAEARRRKRKAVEDASTSVNGHQKQSAAARNSTKTTQGLSSSVNEYASASSGAMYPTNSMMQHPGRSYNDLVTSQPEPTQNAHYGSMAPPPFTLILAAPLALWRILRQLRRLAGMSMVPLQAQETCSPASLGWKHLATTTPTTPMRLSTACSTSLVREKKSTTKATLLPHLMPLHQEPCPRSPSQPKTA
jgi:hypothetical protein